YLDKDRKGRQPENRNFEPGEFERLYRSIPTVEFVFEKGMKWMDALVMDWIADKAREEKPELELELLRIDREGYHPRATFAIASHEFKEAGERVIRADYEKAIQVLESQNRYMIDHLFELSFHALSQPRKQITGPYFENIQVNITITQVIEEVKRIIEEEPDGTFKSKAKKKILETLEDALKDVTKDGLKEAGKKIFELAQNELVPLLPKIATQLGVLKMMGAF
ncbi:hypothetical protein L0244_38565, partial [bacterium]|nr:hypothetical protein [bacterium]